MGGDEKKVQAEDEQDEAAADVTPSDADVEPPPPGSTEGPGK